MESGGNIDDEEPLHSSPPEVLLLLRDDLLSFEIQAPFPSFKVYVGAFPSLRIGNVHSYD